MASDVIRIAVEVFVLLILAPGIIYTGWQRYHTCAIPPNSVEFWGVVSYVNIYNALRGRALVHTLIPEQIRCAGFWYMAVGIIAWIATALILVIGER